MRIADRKNDIRVGQSSELDATAIAEIDTSIARLSELNARFWSVARQHGYPI